MIITEFQKEISEKLTEVDRLNSLNKKTESLNLLTEKIGPGYWNRGAGCYC